MPKDYKERVIETLFIDNASFTRDQFTNIAKALNPTIHQSRKTERDIIKSNMSLVSVQKLINRHLRSFGKVLKSKDYYSTFYVSQDKSAFREVARYKRTAKNLNTCAEELQAGMEMRQQVLDIMSK